MKVAFIDSGIGGLIFAIDFVKKLNTVYKKKIDAIHIGDTKNVPYGLKTPTELVNLVKNLFNEAMKLKADIVIVACNTAATVIDDKMKEFYLKNHNLTIITIIEESSAEIYAKTPLINNQKHIAILGTKQTIQSKKYEDAINNLKQQEELSIYPYSPVEWEQLIEKGVDKQQIKETVNHHLSIFMQQMTQEVFAKITSVGLFCTHYPYFKDEIKDFFSKHTDAGSNVQIISQGEIFINSIDIKSLENFSEKQQIHSFITGNDIESIKTVSDNIKDYIDIDFCCL